MTHTHCNWHSKNVCFLCGSCVNRPRAWLENQTACLLFQFQCHGVCAGVGKPVNWPMFLPVYEPNNYVIRCGRFPSEVIQHTYTHDKIRNTGCWFFCLFYVCRTFCYELQFTVAVFNFLVLFSTVIKTLCTVHTYFRIFMKITDFAVRAIK